MPVKDGKLRWPNKVLAGLQETVADMIAEPDLQVVLQKAVERTAELVGADIVTIHIYDPLTGEVSTAAGHGLLDRDAFQQHEPSRGKVALLVAGRGEPIIAEDVSASELAGPFAAREGVQSAAGFPLKVSDKVIGVLFVNYREPHKFEPEEVNILVSFGNLAAVAINTARSYKQANARAQTIRQLGEVGQSLTTLQESPEVLQETLERIANMALQVLEADIVDLYQYQADKDDFVLPPTRVGEHRFPDLVPTQIFPDDVVVQIAHIGNAVYASDAQEHPVLTDDWELPREEMPKERFVVREEIISSAAVPMKVGEEVVGIMFASYRQKRDFDAEAELRQRIEVLASYGAIAINNARLVQHLRDRADEIELLQQVSAQISTTLNLDEILPLLIESAMRLTETKSGVVHVLDSTGKKIVDSYGYPEEFSHPSPRISEEGYTRLIIQVKKQQVVEDARIDERANPDIEKKGVRSFVGTPLKLAGERVVGVLYVNDTAVRRFTKEELSLLSALADQAAIAVENARLLEETIQRAEGIAFANKVGRSLSATRDIKEIPRLLVKATLKAFDAEAGSLALINTETQEIEFQFALDYKGSERFDEIMKGYKMPLDKGIAGAVVQSGVPVISNNVQEDPRWHRDVDSVTGFTTKSILAVPLIYGNQVIGIIEILNKQDGSPFLEREKDCLTTLALSAAIAIENARLFQERDKRAMQLARLHEITATISAEPPDIDKISRLIVDSLGDIFQGASCAIRLYDSKTDTFRPQIATGIMEDWVDHLPRHDGTSRHAVQKKEPRYLEGNALVSPHDGGPAIRKDILALGVKAVAYLPLISEEDAVGILYVNLTDPHRFSLNEKQILELFADQAASAIENARLYGQRARDIAALQEINQVITTESRAKIISLVAKKAQELTEAEYIGLWTVEGDRLVPGAMYGQGLMEIPELPIDEHSINGLVAMTEKPYKCFDVDSDPHYKVWREDVQSSVAFPLKFAGRVIGTLGAESTKRNAFSDYQLELLRSLANQAAIAIENTRLFEETKAHAGKLTALYETGQAITSVLELDALLQLIAKRSAQLTGADRALILLVDAEAEELTGAVGSGFAPGQIEIFTYQEIQDGISGWVLREGTPTISEDILTDSRNIGLAFQMAKKERERGKSLAVAPLIFKGKMIGTLTVINKVGKPVFNQGDLGLVTMLANQAAIAIENARMYEQRSSDLAALQEINEAVVSKTSSEILDLIVKKAVEVMPGEYGELWLKELATGDLIREAVWGPAEAIAQETGRLKAGVASINMQVAETGQPYICDDVRKEPDFYPIYKDARSSVTVPLEHQGEVIGTLNVESSRLKAFAEQHSQLLNSFADQAAIAVENAQLVESLRAVNEVGQTLTDSAALSEGQILELIYEQATPLMDTSDMYIALYEPDPEQPDEYKQEEQSIIHGTVRFGLVRDNKRRVDVEHEEGWRPRKAGLGLTEHVIRARRPFRPADVGKEYTIAKDYIRKIPKSWMGVPMMVKNEVLGVVVLRNDENENVYNKDDQEVLQTIATQSAIALQNARLVQQLEQRVRELDTLQELAEEFDIGTLPDVM